MVAKPKLYKEPSNKIGAKVLLFDRFIDDNMEQKTDPSEKLCLNFGELVASIEREIKRILNTRSTTRKSEFNDDEGEDFNNQFEEDIEYALPAMFGVCDFNSLDGANPNQWKRIAYLCKQSIEHFEPRISNVVTKVESFNPQNQSLTITISGFVKLETMREVVQFPIFLDFNQRH